MNYKLLPMDRSHMEFVLAIEQGAFSDPWSERIFEDALYNDSISMIVAQGDNGAVLGYGEISVILDEGCLEKIAVSPAYRRQGIAQEILGAFLRFGEAYLSFLTLEVRESNDAAIALYTKLGFKEEGRRKGYYSDTKEDAIIMTKEFVKNGESEAEIADT